MADAPFFPPEPTPWPPQRTRRLGALILVACLLGAGGLYRSETRALDAPEGDLLAGYNRQRDHDMGVLYGRGGRDLMNALNEVNSPAGHAVLLVAAGLIAARLCFYRARLVEDGDRPAGGA